MSLLLQINLIISCIILLIIVFINITRNNLQIKYSLIWIFSSIVFLLLAIFPQLVKLLASLTGIQVGSNIVFLIMNIFFYFISISLTISISKSSMKIKTMAQEIALLKFEISQMEQRITAYDEKNVNLQNTPYKKQ